jgi:hypothetical protein
MYVGIAINTAAAENSTDRLQEEKMLTRKSCGGH